MNSSLSGETRNASMTALTVFFCPAIRDLQRWGNNNNNKKKKMKREKKYFD